MTNINVHGREVGPPERPGPPDGFLEVETLGQSLMGLICATCGAVVARDHAQRHLNWHSLLSP